MKEGWRHWMSLRRLPVPGLYGWISGAVQEDEGVEEEEPKKTPGQQQEPG